MSPTGKTILTLVVFCIAMAALESSVVVYLRALYYPDGFTVMLKIINQEILLIEIAREAATVVMLLSVGYLAGNTFKNRFAYFLMAFAVWDISYYVWLKVFIDWPSSLLDWDILFLIPFTWLGPVLAPVICSLTMIVSSVMMLRSSAPVSKRIWILFGIGSAIILFTFLKDYGWIIFANGLYGEYLTIMQNKQFLDIAGSYTPQSYAWDLFTVGQLFILAGIFMIGRGR